MSEIRKIYLAHFFSGLVGVASFVPLYLLSNGISQAQLAFLVSVNILSLSILEIPTGSIADTYGHKLSVFLGTLIYGLSFLFFIGKSFEFFLVAMTLAGLGLALISGAMSALIFDILEIIGNKDDFKKISGRCDGFFLIATMISAPIGGVIYQYKPELTFIIAFLATLIGSLFLLSIKWNFKKGGSQDISYIQRLTKGVHLTLKSPVLMVIFLISLGLSIPSFVINHNIKQPYLILNGFDVAQIGIFTAIISGLSALFYMYSYKLIERMGNLLSLVLICLIVVITLILMGGTNGFTALVILSIFLLIPAFRDPLINHLQMDNMASEHRATMASTISFLLRLSIAGCLMIWGLIIDKVGINQTFLYLGGSTAVLLLIGIVLLNKYRLIK